MGKSIDQLAKQYQAAQNVAKVVGGREAQRQAEAARQALAAATKRK